MGKTPRLATRMDGLVESRSELDALIERAFTYYREHGRRKERFGHMLDRIGGADRDTGDRGRIAKPLISVLTHSAIGLRAGLGHGRATVLISASARPRSVPIAPSGPVRGYLFLFP